MKTLKLGLFSLLAVLAASVFLTSCEQETTLPDIPDTNIVNSIEFTLPDHITDLDDEAIIEYIESLSEAEIAALISNAANGNLESRGCTSWSAYATATKCEDYCSSNYKLRKKIEWQIRYCFTGPRFRTHTTYLGCSCYV